MFHIGPLFKIPLCILKLFQTYILPILEYSNLCLTYNSTQSDRLEKIQKRITKFICFRLNKYYLNYDQRLEFLNMFSKTERVMCDKHNIDSIILLQMFY